ncbi:PIN domain-containing protein [Candidatus Collierbacteria bacterium]|nr:PIN domain-containing protein [Candidatus Collierbacteria bacterium]
MKIFIDSDVIVSSLISSSGASRILLYQEDLIPIISSHSHSELTIVVKRMSLDQDLFEQLIQNRLKIIPLNRKTEDLKLEYQTYVTDINDAHIVAGAHAADVRYLITYNLRHFQIEKIKNKLNILTLTPSQFIQYLRSL